MKAQAVGAGRHGDKTRAILYIASVEPGLTSADIARRVGAHPAYVRKALARRGIFRNRQTGWHHA